MAFEGISERIEERIKTMKKFGLSVIFAAAVIGFGSLAGAANGATINADDSWSTATTTNNSQTDARMSRQVRKKLVTLPYYGVFDNLGYTINGGTVTLEGQVVRPSTRSDAGKRVAEVAGVTRVVNNIRVLPLSRFDDSLRARTLRSLQQTGGLYRYFLGGNPSLHIIVDRGHVTLAGVVGSNLDKQLAYSAARQVSGSFSVTNDLQVEGEGAR
jgi:hyperosmotically inducible periplasmic protein